MIEAMKDRLAMEGILTVLGGGMCLANLGNREFREFVAQRQGVAEIRTQDRCVARRFLISHATLRVARGSHPCPDYAIVYKDATEAVAVMSKGSQEAALQAITEGTMWIEGDMEFGMWFNELLQKTGEILKKPKNLIKL